MKANANFIEIIEDDLRDIFDKWARGDLEPTQETEHLISIVSEGEVVVTIYYTGAIDIADGYTPDDAARAFWESVERYAKDALRRG